MQYIAVGNLFYICTKQKEQLDHWLSDGEALEEAIPLSQVEWSVQLLLGLWAHLLKGIHG
jgi:hypothetical protein